MGLKRDKDFFAGRGKAKSRSSQKIEKLRKRPKYEWYQPTESERILIRRLEGAGILFSSNTKVGKYNVDLLIPPRLIVEVEGSVHFKTWQRDLARENWLTSVGYRVLRFSNDQVKFSIEEVMARISEVLARAR